MPTPESPEACERIICLENTVETLKENQKLILEQLGDIKGILSKYQGTIGGIVLVFSFLGVAWGVLQDYLKAHWVG